MFLTSLYRRRFPDYTAQDIEIIYMLFVLFVIIRGIERNGVADKVSSLLFRGRFVSQKIVFFTMVLSMFVTNDVAVLLAVPFVSALNMDKRERLVIFVIIAANAGSALTPFGNPQNLFLYWFYQLSPLEFIRAVAPLTFVIGMLILALSFSAGRVTHVAPAEKCPLNGRMYLQSAFLLLFITAILRILPIYIGVIILLYTLIWDRRSFNVDYALLLTFFFFFGFTDNLSVILSSGLENHHQVFAMAAILSQVMSNVPATLLLADFTSNWKALLWGVNVGGFGCLFGSFANIIGYRLYVTRRSGKKPDSRRFLLWFHVYSYAAFFIAAGMYLVVKAWN